MKSVKTAIIPVSGYGTRRLPITKAIEKCMLPIHDRPAVDFVVEECAAAGIEHIVFVVGEESSQLQKYYGRNQKLEEYLLEHGKQSELEIVNSTSRGLRFTYITQPPNGAYGTAVPVYLALGEVLSDEYFAVMMGDDFVYRDDGGSDLAEALADFQVIESDHLMLGAEVPRELATGYGVLRVNDSGNLEDILEKPSLDSVPVPSMINISKYIFSKKITGILEDYMQKAKAAGQEYFLTDVVLDSITKGQKMNIRPISGQYLDVGNAGAWLIANNAVALNARK